MLYVRMSFGLSRQGWGGGKEVLGVVVWNTTKPRPPPPPLPSPCGLVEDTGEARVGW